MSPETKVALTLASVFAVGIGLVAIGLGFNTKGAALGVGVLLCLAATRLLAGGPSK